MKMEKKKKKRSHRYDMKIFRSGQGHRDSKYKKCLIMIILICTEQLLGNI